MRKILVAYASDRGNTLAAADAVAEGCASVTEASVEVAEVDGLSSGDVADADGVILGVPVRMGAADWRIQRFAARCCGSLWTADRMVGRVGGVFGTCGGYGGAGGGGEFALLGALATLVELGLVIVPLPRSTPGYARGGLHWGPLLRTADDEQRSRPLDSETLTVARLHGAHVARVATALAGRRLLHDSTHSPVPAQTPSGVNQP